MRVALVTTSYPSTPGDASGHFVQAEARLLARDAEVHVFTSGHRSTTSPTRGDDGVTVWRGGGSAFGWPGVVARVRENPLRVASVVTWSARVRARLATSPRFDRVVAHWAVPSALIAAPLGVPLEIVSHGADVRLLARLPAPLRDTLMAHLLRDASVWRFVSQSLHDQLASTLGARVRTRLEAITVIRPSPIEVPDVASAVTARRNAHQGEKVVVCVGRLVPGKRFVRALDHVARAPHPRPRVVVVGDGPERARLERHARALGLDARFVGLVTRDDALAWIGAADALLHASLEEGLSTVVREAEALGVPVEIVT